MKILYVICVCLILCSSCKKNVKQNTSIEQNTSEKNEVDSAQYSVEDMEASGEDYSFNINEIVENNYYYNDRQNELLNGNVYSITDVIHEENNNTSFLPIEGENGVTISKTFTPEGNYKSCLVKARGYSDRYYLKKYLLRFVTEGKILNMFNKCGKIDFNFSILRPFDNFTIPESYYNNIAANFTYSNVLEEVKLTNSLTHRYEYNTDGKLIKRWENDLPKLQIDWSGNLISSIKLYDNNGYEHQITSVGIDANIIVVPQNIGIGDIYYEYTFNDLGQIIEQKEYKRASGSETILYGTKIFEYQNGVIVKETERVRYRSYWIENEILSSYDEFGNVVGLTMIRDKGKSEMSETNYKFIYQYDSNDNWTEKQIYNVVKGDIEIEDKICTVIRNINYYE